MPRINISKFAARQGATLACDKCRNPIAKGEAYRHFKVGFRYGRKQVRCMRPECSPRQSELTNSKMSGVYVAIEAAEDDLTALEGNPEDDTSSITSALQTAAEGINEVADEYREANEASPTGFVFGEDLNERADEIADAASELESWSPEDDEPDYDQCDEHPDEGCDFHEQCDKEACIVERGDTMECSSCDTIKTDWWDAQIEGARDALSNVSL